MGHNDNPSCREFIHIFKKLMVRNHVKGLRGKLTTCGNLTSTLAMSIIFFNIFYSGNCLPLDDTVILSTTSSRPTRIIDAEEVSLYKRLDETIRNSNDEQADDDELAWMDVFAPISMTIDYKDAILTHIAG